MVGWEAGEGGVIALIFNYSIILVLQFAVANNIGTEQTSRSEALDLALRSN